MILNRITLAFKAFFKAFKDPELGQKFVKESAPKQIETADRSHLRLLHYLQQEGRLIDFLKEDIKGFTDAQIGAAVRKIHQDCRQVLEELVSIRPVKEEEEGTVVHVASGYNPNEIKIVGKIKGEPPFKGVLIHKGWKALKRSLPKQMTDHLTDVICPAEIEIKS